MRTPNTHQPKDIITYKDARSHQDAENAHAKDVSGTPGVVWRVVNGGTITFDLSDMDVFTGATWRVKGKRWKYVITGRFGRRKFHREIMNARPGEVVDHIDGDTLNNSRSNLRLCTNSQNIRNMKPRAGKRFKGISLIARSGMYRAQIMYQRVKINLGNYPTAEAAAMAYDAHARKLDGEFARCNFPVV